MIKNITTPDVESRGKDWPFWRILEKNMNYKILEEVNPPKRKLEAYFKKF